MRLAIIDVLKGIAILCVLALHFFTTIAIHMPEAIWTILCLCSVPLFMLLMAFNFANSWNRNPKLNALRARNPCLLRQG